jgi:hypothetical protein
MDSRPQCTGAKVRAPRADGFWDEVVPARIVAAPGMRCSVTIEVLNSSGRQVDLQHAEAHLAGPRTGMVVRVNPREHPQDVGTVPERWEPYDAYLPLRTSVGSEESHVFTVHLVFKARGACRGAGGGGVGRSTLERWPEVTFTVWGRTFTRSASHPLSVEQRARAMGCHTRGS